MRKKGVSNCVLFKLIYHFYMSRPTITGTSFTIVFKCVPFPIFICLFLFLYFPDWCEENGHAVSFEQLPVEDLAALLRQFYGNVRNSDGSKYSKSSLCSMRAGIQRHLTTPPHSRTVNIITDVEFQSAKNVFRGDLKRNKRKGNDKTSSYPPISEGDLEKLHESEVMNVDNPMDY